MPDAPGMVMPAPSGRAGRDAALVAAAWGAAGLMTGAFAWILGDLLAHGAAGLSPDFFFSRRATAAGPPRLSRRASAAAAG